MRAAVVAGDYDAFKLGVPSGTSERDCHKLWDAIKKGMNIREDLNMEEEPKLLKADGFDDAIIGVATQFDRQFIVYDYDKVIMILRRDTEMSEEEAVEYYDFNIVGSYVGESTPAFLKKYEEVVDEQA